MMEKGDVGPREEKEPGSGIVETKGRVSRKLGVRIHARWSL